MSSVGKGRGRGFADVRDTPLRRPGQMNVSKFDDLINLIDNLFINDLTYGEKVNTIVQAMNNSLKTSSLKELFENLHKQALEDRQFGVKLAILCSNPDVYTLNDCNLRLILLQALQKDYDELEQIKQKSIMQFRNAVSLLGGVYCNLKINNKSMDILSVPLLHCLESLLDASEEEDIELVTIQVLINGSNLLEQSSPQFEDFLISVRQVLVNRNLSAKSRGMLLFIIDIANQHFSPIYEKIREFYTKNLDGSPFIEIKNHIQNMVNVTKLATDVYEFYVSDELRNHPDKTRVENNFDSLNKKILQEEVGVRFITTGTSSLKMNSEKLSLPRAIRGTGAVDKEDENDKILPEGKEHRTSEGKGWSSKSNISSKVWGHDDRFDKDYT